MSADFPKTGDPFSGAGFSAFDEMEIRRYQRHFQLPEVGPEGQQKLRAGRVLIVGAGGLGAPAALYLAAAGVGTIGIVENDRLDVSNLQRQILYQDRDAGRPKLPAAVERLRQLNPGITIIPHHTRLTAENAAEIIAAYDIILDGSDNFPTRYLINDACVLWKKTCVYGSIFRFLGQISVFAPGEGPCYRCLYPAPPPPELVPDCAEGGVLGALPGVIGSLQALETLKLITGSGSPLIGRLILFDGLQLSFQELILPRRASCPLCGDNPTISELQDYDSFCGISHTAGKSEITPGELRTRLESAGPELLLLDVREPFERAAAHIGGLLIPIAELADRITEIPATADIIIYCQSGRRSLKALEMLTAAGFSGVRHLHGGLNAWQEEFEADSAE